MKKILCVSLYLLFFNALNSLAAYYSVVDTGQDEFYGNNGEIERPEKGSPFYGQDAQYDTNTPSYRDNGNGTVTDLNTRLTWTKAVDSEKLSLEEAEKKAKALRIGGSAGWRVPAIKELYSLINFNGDTGFDGPEASRIAKPFIDTVYFDFKYGQTYKGERYADAQWLSSTRYVSTTIGGAETVFAVNFADGMIKGYGYKDPSGIMPEKRFYVRYVRGNPGHMVNSYIDNGDGTITDKATGLMWMKNDSQTGMSWEDALKYAVRSRYAGYDDWRLPNAKELQSIVDYTRSPDTTFSAAIDPIFETSSVINERGEKDYPYFWTSTTHLNGPHPGKDAVYIAFGRALGKMNGRIMDVHGAGSQRSDPKEGLPGSIGLRGELIRSNNFVRCVRGGE